MKAVRSEGEDCKKRDNRVAQGLIGCDEREPI